LHSELDRRFITVECSWLNCLCGILRLPIGKRSGCALAPLSGELTVWNVLNFSGRARAG
jgi:hypothetical protein